ncbi:tetratricopeptide repeat protein [Actinoplanes sp. NBRC 101535]|uniref:tetratricopeptide repeat protein n=1 Tax=Actinoplanes sp. NBRC 101535 TaxID=3032196 RepID=UPI0024A06466|nr:tetratricopeptide repeat protein [Actinoplanes sp. NBRC 101535]GLY04187.1 hypothetical protein Acsp01_45660 [Actinoplanes sp. NBRC 101535]
MTLPAPVFVSHASADDTFVAELRILLEDCRIPVWVDSRELRGGSRLAPEIEAAIRDAAHVVAVLSPATINSPWVRREITSALAVGRPVIPLLLPGITPAALTMWFPEEPVAIEVDRGPGGLSAAAPRILAALGRRLPDDAPPFREAGTKPVEELVLKLTDPTFEEAGGRRRVRATATLIYEPAARGARHVESRRFVLTAPWDSIAADDLAWYLQSYYRWPAGVFRRRAEEIQERLPVWGRALHTAALGDPAARAALTAWQTAADGADRRFSVMVDGDLPTGSASTQAQASAREAATVLLTLPWELLHDERGWLFQGRDAVRVRRRLPNREVAPARPAALPVRILLVSPRPEHDGRGGRVSYLDHRSSARPLVEAVEELGDLARLTVLPQPSYAALEQALGDGDQGRPFDVVHFDGHGVYDRRIGLGGLCFEAATDPSLLEVVDADRLAGLVRRHRIPLVFLEACQSATAENDPTASVAARLLNEGVTSVVAMSHSVLVETARRFVHAFYAALARGARVGTAMLAGQQALHADPVRGRVRGAGELRLQDWFVPVLYQEEHDPQLITRIAPGDVREQQRRRRRFSLGALPEPPGHRFHGRSRDLLALERLLTRSSWAVVRGTGGQGKTTLAAELARWLVRTGRFGQAAFVSLEHHCDDRAVLDTIGSQLAGPRYSVAEFDDLTEALQPVERALRNRPTILVVDNCESALLGEPGPIFALCETLVAAGDGTRLLFTTRESLPAPFDRPERALGALDSASAIELVGQVLKQQGLVPPEQDAGETPQQIADLVEAVGRHARALVLLAPEVARAGVTAATADLHEVMVSLERRHPGDRENSLYASVELSLRRLPPGSRTHAAVLAVCPGGTDFVVLKALTGLEPRECARLAFDLVKVGLAESAEEGYLRLDPGLAPYLMDGLDTERAELLRGQWAEAMETVTALLYVDRYQNAAKAARLAALEVPHLLSMLDQLQKVRPPEDVVLLASQVETLMKDLGRAHAAARAAGIRRQAASRLGEWSHARFVDESSRANVMSVQGDDAGALLGFQQVLSRCIAAGDDAYEDAAFDTAQAQAMLGTAQHAAGSPDAGLITLLKAESCFRHLAAAGDEEAARNVTTTLAEIGACLCDLGRFQEATKACESAIALAVASGDVRVRTVASYRLGTVHLLQGNLDKALRAYHDARDVGRELGDESIALPAMHQIGMVHRKAGRFEESEDAYRDALAMAVRQKDLSNQVSALTELGGLYNYMGRPDDAVAFYRRGIDISGQQGDLLSEGIARNNLAETLIVLGRLDEARPELQRAAVCVEPFGAHAQPWTVWALWESLERSAGNRDAAAAARRRAIGDYLDYRRAGGENRTENTAFFDLVLRAFDQGTQAPAIRSLEERGRRDQRTWVVALSRSLAAFLGGSRDAGLADDTDLDYMDAAEMAILLYGAGAAPAEHRRRHGIG